MSATPRLLGILLVLTASSSVALLWKLHEAHVRIEALQTAVQREPTVPPSPAGMETNPTAAIPVMEPSGSDPLDTTRHSAQASTRSGNPADDPDFALAEITSMRLTLMQEHPDLASALQLSTAEASAVLDILANTRLARSRRIPTSVAQDREEAELRALLGVQRLAKWMDYERNAPFRRSVAAVKASLSATGLQPLSDEQSRSLLNTLAAERDRREAEFSRAAAELNTAEAGFMQSFRDAALRADEDMIQRISVAAAAELTPEQLSILRLVLEEPLRQQLRTRRLREAR